jgi:hypothetical protein
MKSQALLLSLLIFIIYPAFTKPLPLAEVPNEEIIVKMKTALAPLFQENQDYVLSDVSVTEASGGYRISATATFFQINSVTLVGTFSSADVFARLELRFPEGSNLPDGAQKKMAKENFTNWIPADIRKVVALKSLYMEFAQNTISTIGIQFAGQKDWSPVNGIAAKNILVDFNLNNPLAAVSISSTLKSNLSLGDVNIDMGATLSSDPKACVLSGDVSSLSLGNIMSSIGVSKAPEWPDAIWNLAMSKGSISVAPFAKTLNISTTSDLGQVEFMINASATPTQFMLGVAPPSDFSFKRIDQNLGVLDNVGLKNTAIVLASSTQKTRLNICKK